MVSQVGGVASIGPRFAPSKFSAPPLVSHLVPRSRLFEELDRGAGHRLTLVVGAPGAGKTTLLANWRSARPDVPSAWVGCDAGDGDPVRFVSALVQGMRAGFDEPGLGQNALELLGVEGEASIDVIGALADDLEGLAGTRVVTIDDFQLVTGPSAQAFERFLDVRPGSLQVIVATRSDPPLRLHRMRAQEELVEVRDVDLAFSAGETKGFFSRFGLDLSDADIASVQRRTEGWSAGLQMTALSIRTSPDPESSLRRAEVQSATVAGYFVEEVLRQQPPAVVDFMLASSVLDELSVPACTAVLGPGAAAMLDHLVQAHLFVAITDEDAGTYRYHQLIREVLQSELRRRDPAREAELHEAVARHLLDAGHAGAAARHLLAAGESTDAFELLSDRVVRDVLTNPTVGSPLDLDEFRPELFAGVPEVLVPLAAELLWRGAFEPGARAVALLRRVEVDPAREVTLAVRLGLVNTLYCSFVGEFEEALSHRARVRSFEPDATGVDDWIVSLDALDMYCRAFVGDFDGARQMAKDLVAGGSSVPLTEVLCPGVLSQAEFIEGHLDVAAGLAETTLRAARHLRFEGHYFVFHALRTAGQLALERRDLPAAIEQVETALGIVNGARPAFNYLAQVDRARIWAAGGHPEAALASLPAARAALKSTTSVLLAEADEAEARFRLRLGDGSGAREAAQRLPPARRAVVLAILALADGDVVAAERALDTAPAGEPTVRWHVERRLLGAVIALVGSRRAAPDLIRGALADARRHGFVQTVLDTAPQLLEHVVAEPELYLASRELDPVVAAHLDAESVGGARPRPNAAPLTEAEIRVLQRLARRLTYSEIAAELYISLNTVKTHVGHAYTKLGVSSRASAIARAAALGLLG